LFLFLPLLKE